MSTKGESVPAPGVPATEPYSGHPLPRGRILLISYHFGEGCETGGFRWNAMVRDLVTMGWTFDVITCERPALRVTGDADAAPSHPVEVFAAAPSDLPQRFLASLFALVRRGKPANYRESTPSAPRVAESRPPIALSQVDVWQPGTRQHPRQRLLKAIQGLATYVADRIWVGRATRLGSRLARRRSYQCVVVSSPPHTTQLVGATLSRRHGLPHIADFRDPWVAGTGVLRPFINATTRLVAGIHEPRVLRAASVVVFNTHEASRMSAQVFGNLARRRVVVANGGDGHQLAPGMPDRDVFRILFAGWLHPYMDVRAMIAGASRLLRATGLDPSRFRVELLGSGPEFGGVPIVEIARACEIDQCTTVYDRLPREQALAFQQRAAVLVAYTCPHGLEIAMKFYDYVQMHGALLLIGHPTGALAQAAATVGARVVAPDDEEGIDEVLRAAYDRWVAGRYDTPHDPEGSMARVHRSREMDAVLAMAAAQH